MVIMVGVKNGFRGRDGSFDDSANENGDNIGNHYGGDGGGKATLVTILMVKRCSGEQGLL